MQEKAKFMTRSKCAFVEKRCSRVVMVLYRGTVAHQGPVRQCQGLSLLLILDLFYHSGVPQNIDKIDQGCHEAKKVEKHCSRVLAIFEPQLLIPIAKYEKTQDLGLVSKSIHTQMMITLLIFQLSAHSHQSHQKTLVQFENKTKQKTSIMLKYFFTKTGSER